VRVEGAASSETPPLTRVASRDPGERSPTRPFAETPITGFAEGIADLALAAVEGRPLPPSPVPTREPLMDEPQRVEWWPPDSPRPSRLEVLAVALEVELILKRGGPDDQGAVDERFGAVLATLVVNRNGLRVVSARPRAAPPSTTDRRPPPGLEGLPEAARQVLAALRSGDLAPFELDERDRRLLANDTVWAQLRADAARDLRGPRIRSLLDGLPEMPLSYKLDDVGVLARDQDGRLFGLGLELDAEGESFVLTTTPLVQARRLWPR
jgi:hypothetical protein